MKKVTMDTIAHELGTTKNTVSRALRGQTGVSEELRQKIMELAEQYGYKKTSLRPKQTSPSKVTMVCNSKIPHDTYFWPSVMSGIFEYSAMHQIAIHTVIIDIIKDDIKYLLPLQEKYCDGILVLGTLPDAQLDRISKLGIPMVVVDHYSDFVQCDYINTANYNGTVKAVDFLVAKGHKKIGFLNNELAPYTDSFTSRYEGYCKRLEDLGLEIDPNFIWPNSNYDNHQYYRDQLDKLIKYGDAPTAWVCVNDLTAYHFYHVLTERGLRIPEDVSVIGFDNITGGLPLQLTTLEIPQRTMGRTALSRLMRRLRQPNEPFESIEIFTRLIDRGSVQTI